LKRPRERFGVDKLRKTNRLRCLFKHQRVVVVVVVFVVFVKGV
jgi:hypothetical protein